VAPSPVEAQAPTEILAAPPVASAPAESLPVASAPAAEASTELIAPTPPPAPAVEPPDVPAPAASPAETVAAATATAAWQPRSEENDPTQQLPVVPALDEDDVPAVERTAELPPIRKRPPRRRYFRELRKARDHGMELFDKAAEDQSWEHEDDR